MVPRQNDKVLTEKAKPTVVVHWDPMPDVEGKENLSNETQQVLPPRKWNKDVEGAWRMDIETNHDSEVETDSDSNSLQVFFYKIGSWIILSHQRSNKG
jgi:hypothetical protein